MFLQELQTERSLSDDKGCGKYLRTQPSRYRDNEGAPGQDVEDRRLKRKPKTVHYQT